MVTIYHIFHFTVMFILNFDVIVRYDLLYFTACFITDSVISDDLCSHQFTTTTKTQDLFFYVNEIRCVIPDILLFKMFESL